MKYIDGFVIPLAKKNVAAYKKYRPRRARFGWSMARSPIWKRSAMT